MTTPAPLTQFIKTYRFADVVTLWARERLEHEAIVASALARAVICDGMRLQSIDDRWANDSNRQPIEFRGYPYVGYTAGPDGSMSILRASALEHLFAIVERGEEPQMGKLGEEFITREDFHAWLFASGLPLPRFWFPPHAAEEESN
ncbi:MAG TPA: hypothetical protein VGD24_05765 [Gallionella sp.]